MNIRKTTNACIIFLLLIGCNFQMPSDSNNQAPTQSQDYSINYEDTSTENLEKEPSDLNEGEDTSVKEVSLSWDTTGTPQYLVFNSENDKLAILTLNGLWIQNLNAESTYGYVEFENIYFNGEPLTQNHFFWIPNLMTFLTSADNTYLLLDAEEKQIIDGPFVSTTIIDAMLTPEGILYANENRHGQLFVWLYDMYTFELIREIYNFDYSEPVGIDLLLSPDGNRLLSGPDVINLSTKEQVILDGDCDPNKHDFFLWSPDGRYIYSFNRHPSAENDDSVCFRRYDVENKYKREDLTQAVYSDYEYNSEKFYSAFVVFSPMNNLLASIFSEYYRNKTGELIVEGHSFDQFEHVTECNIRIYDSENFSIIQNISFIRTTEDQWHRLNDAVWSNDGKYLAIIEHDVKIFDVLSGDMVLEIPFTGSR